VKEAQPGLLGQFFYFKCQTSVWWAGTLRLTEILTPAEEASASGRLKYIREISNSRPSTRRWENRSWRREIAKKRGLRNGSVSHLDGISSRCPQLLFGCRTFPFVVSRQTQAANTNA